MQIERSPENPILVPDKTTSWEAEAAFNPSVILKDDVTHLVYRAVSSPQTIAGATLEVSSIGHALSRDGIHFENRTQIISPEHGWERYGCEDPRITEFEGQYFIFYTALSKYPFTAEGIKVGVAVTSDFKAFVKHLVTPFNAKAMSLFPERINGKIAAILAVNTDRPPVKICLAFFDSIEDIWSQEYWKTWYENLNAHVLPVERSEKDQIEVGAPPLKTKDGWLIFYSYIYNYFSPPAVFGIQAALLDLKDPSIIVGESKRPFFVSEAEYELYGNVANIVFPSGALMRKKTIYLYYGGADTVSCVATMKAKDLMDRLIIVRKRQLTKFKDNPIIAPIPDHAWESKATFNPGALYENWKVHLLYRAMSGDNTSVLGYAASVDGKHISERNAEPAYAPREDFEKKNKPGENSGCEDPRLTKLGDAVYMCYTAFDGEGPPRVAFTSIALDDFLHQRWQWKKPILISPPGVDDKDAALFPEKIGGKYVFLHRLGTNIWIDFLDDLTFANNRFLGGTVLVGPRDTAWDSKRIGIAAPPIKTRAGWLLLYHGISKRTSHYNVRAMLLHKRDPRKILCRTYDTILEPAMPYEKEGIVPNVVFPCGAVAIKNQLFVYYGAADKVVCVATVDLDNLIRGLLYESKIDR